MFFYGKWSVFVNHKNIAKCLNFFWYERRRYKHNALLLSLWMFKNFVCILKFLLTFLSSTLNIFAHSTTIFSLSDDAVNENENPQHTTSLSLSLDDLKLNSIKMIATNNGWINESNNLSFQHWIFLHLYGFIFSIYILWWWWKWWVKTRTQNMLHKKHFNWIFYTQQPCLPLSFLLQIDTFPFHLKSLSIYFAFLKYQLKVYKSLIGI